MTDIYTILMKIEKTMVSIQVSLRWHKMLILALYGILGAFLISSFPKGSATGLASFTGFAVLNNSQEVINMDWQPFAIILAALLRSILGWAKVSFKDGYLQDFELKKLGETVVRVGVIGLVVIYMPGLNTAWFESAAIILGGDLLLNAVKKRRTEPIK